MLRNTLQNCLSYEGIVGHSAGFIVGAGVKEWTYNVQDIAVHKNLFVANNLRNPLISAFNAQVVNNGIVNSGYSGLDTQTPFTFDVIGNFMEDGDDTSQTNNLKMFHMETAYPELFPGEVPSIYQSDNQYDMMWNENGTDFGVALPEEFKRTTPQAPFSTPITIHSKESVRDYMLQDSGDSRGIDRWGRWNRRRNSSDARIIAEAIAGTTVVDTTLEQAVARRPSHTEIMNYPTTNGVSDAWLAHYGFDGTTDLWNKNLSVDYTNFECFMNGTHPVVVANEVTDVVVDNMGTATFVKLNENTCTIESTEIQVDFYRPEVSFQVLDNTGDVNYEMDVKMRVISGTISPRIIKVRSISSGSNTEVDIAGVMKAGDIVSYFELVKLRNDTTPNYVGFAIDGLANGVFKVEITCSLKVAI